MQVVIVEGPGDPTRFTLDTPATAGGSRADGVYVPGLEPAALRLEPCPAGVVVTPTVFGARVAGHPVAPGARRLLRPGEETEVSGVTLALTSPPAEGTRALAGAMLLGASHAGRALLVLTGPAAGTRHPLRHEVVLGRGRGAGLRLPDAQVSRRHARVGLRGSQVEVEDLGSKNGIRVNGVRVERSPVALAPGDELGVGETALTLEDPAAPDCRDPALPRGRVPPAAAAAVVLALSAAALLVAAS